MDMPIVLSRAQCAARYNTLKAPKASGKWTAEEDRQLQELAEEFPETTKNRWNLISSRMTSRTGKQCRNQCVHLSLFFSSHSPNGSSFYEILDQSVERGEWKETEDEIIKEAIRSSTKVDCKRLAEQLNRPITMVRDVLQRIKRMLSERGSFVDESMLCPKPRRRRPSPRCGVEDLQLRTGPERPQALRPERRTVNPRVKTPYQRSKQA